MADAASNLRGEQWIGGRWLVGEADQPPLENRDPWNGRLIWTGRAASRSQVELAIETAEAARPGWANRPLTERLAIAERFAEQLTAGLEELAELISQQTGKPLWESKAEVQACIGKVRLSIEALQHRRSETVEAVGSLRAVTRYRPLGCLLVLGPFNLPAHLPGGHIVPGLLAGNTIVFKPSPLTAGVGEWLAAAWERAGLPGGVLNLIHGEAEVAEWAVADRRLGGVLLTGSRRAGQLLQQQLVQRPETLLALELGGNNPLVVDRTGNVAAAVYQVLLSAYITSGQRCSCARRLILIRGGSGPEVLQELATAIDAIRVGDPLGSPQPFMGSLINPAAAAAVLQQQQRYIEQLGMRPWREAKLLPDHPASLTPGLLEAIDQPPPDQEVFGPLLVVQWADSLEQATDLANRTEYGLSAGLLSDDPQAFAYFVERVRAGIVNWNRHTTGASGRLPFGGIGASGNHRPSGFFAADYCSYPVASLEADRLDMPTEPEPGLEEAHARLCR